MKYTLELPDDEAAFVVAVIRKLSAAAKLTPVKRPKARAATTAQTETDYLLSNPANARELMESIAQADRDELLYHPLRPA